MFVGSTKQTLWSVTTNPIFEGIRSAADAVVVVVVIIVVVSAG